MLYFKNTCYYSKQLSKSIRYCFEQTFNDGTVILTVDSENVTGDINMSNIFDEYDDVDASFGGYSDMRVNLSQIHTTYDEIVEDAVAAA